MTSSPPDLLPIDLEDGSGYIDREGTVVVPPIYDDVCRFAEGLGRVQLDDRDGFVDHQGDLQIPLELWGCDLGFSEGLCQVIATTASHDTTAPRGYVDRWGKIAIHPRFEEAGRFSDGVAVVKEGGRWRVVDHSGAVVLTPTCAYLQRFREGRSVAIREWGKNRRGTRYGIIDRAGQWRLEPVMKRLQSITAGMAAFVRELDNGEAVAGLVDRDGNVQFETPVDNVPGACGEYSEGLLKVVFRGKASYFAADGTVHLDSELLAAFSYAGDFYEGLAFVGFDLGTDASGELSRRFGFMNRQGEVVIEPVFDSVDRFYDGIASVAFEETSAYIDVTGRVIWSGA